MQINRDKSSKNKHRVDYDYKVGNKVMLTNHTSYKYENPYKGPFVITQCFTIGTVMLQFGVTKVQFNICRINSYKWDTKVEDFSSKNM